MDTLETELLDRNDLPLREARRALLDLRRVNRFLFGRSVPRRAMARVMRDHTGKAILLDVAAGTGDVGAAVASSASKRGIALRVVSLDRKLSHLAFGRSLGDVETGVVANAVALPFSDGSVAWSLSTLFLHHLDASGKAVACGEMSRVSEHAAVIVDLMPTWWARALARLLLPALLLAKVARRDGYVSLRHSWTAAEWRQFLAGKGTAEVETSFPARVTIILASDRSGHSER